MAASRQVDRVMAMWQAGLSGDKLYTAVMLIYCGLPLKKQIGTESVVRKAQLGDNSWVRVTFSRKSNLVPLPFGADRTMIYFLTNKAVLQQSPILRWEYANEYMHLFRMDPESGANYRDVQARFTRVAYMDIMVEYLDVAGQVVEHWKCPLIDHARISAKIDREGNWEPTTSISKMLATNQEIAFGHQLFSELQKRAVPIPLELILAPEKKYRIMDYMIFLYWRTFAAGKESFIPWRYLQDQFDSEDSNPRRWAQHFRQASTLFRTLPDPISRIKFDVLSSGVRIYPLPINTTFFDGFPKLGSRNEQGSLGPGASE